MGAGSALRCFASRASLPMDHKLRSGPFRPIYSAPNVLALAPAIAAGAAMILKPSEKTPLSAIRLVELLYEAGLPGWMLSVVNGPLDVVTRPLIRDERVELVTFTGSAKIGKEIALTAGYKKLCLELGGHSPLIVLADADLDLAAELACEGCFRNSGQRCTAVRRILVHEKVLAEFTRRFLAKAKEYPAGDPSDEATLVGTVIDQTAAKSLEAAVREAESLGARVLHGGQRRGALMERRFLQTSRATRTSPRANALDHSPPSFPFGTSMTRSHSPMPHPTDCHRAS